MRVLFVSGIDGFCHRYQVLHRAAQVTALGGAATVRHFADPRVADEVARHGVLFLYRVPATRAVCAAQERARERGVPVVGSIDDLIFVDDPDWLPSLDHLAPDERELWRAGVRRYRATLERCDAFVGPTEPLVDAAASLGWSAHLHRNSLAEPELELARRARTAARPQANGVTLGYFAGTPSHDADLAVAAPALADALASEPSLRLLLVGPVTLPARLEPLAARIVREPLVPWHELPAVMARADVCLAPLALEHRFASAKGEIKYLEAAALGIPTVASPSPAYRHAITDGVNGRLASGDDAWRAALVELARDAALRARLGAAARADLERRWTQRVRAGELLDVLARIRDDARRGARAGSGGMALGAPFDDEPPARVALEADACPALPPAPIDATSPPLADRSRLVQRFRAAVAGLARVDVHAVTYGQRLRHRLRFVLRRDDGTVAGSTLLEASEAPDRAWLALELDRPERGSRGRVYALEIEADGAGAGNAPSFGATTLPGRDAACDGGGVGGVVDGIVGAAELDGVPLDVALVLRGFAVWPDALAGGGLCAGAPARETDALPAAPADAAALERAGEAAAR